MDKWISSKFSHSFHCQYFPETKNIIDWPPGILNKDLNWNRSIEINEQRNILEEIAERTYGSEKKGSNDFQSH